MIENLQSFPREWKTKDIAAMLVDMTKDTEKQSFVKFSPIQHGDYDVTWILPTWKSWRQAQSK